jgi:hypothetical protein
MPLHTHPVQPIADLHNPSSLEGLIAAQFDRAFLFFNVFEDDPRTCLDHCEALFRALDERGLAGELDFYGELSGRILALSGLPELAPGLAREGMLCWLLKDSAELSYADIGALLRLEHGQVRQSIADVRMALLG